MAGTILVVDDEEPVRQLLASILIEQGYRPLSARNGRHAMEYIIEHRARDVVGEDLGCRAVEQSDRLTDTSSRVRPVFRDTRMSPRLVASLGGYRVNWLYTGRE